MESKFTIESLDSSHSEALSKLAEQTFLESHGNSASPSDIQNYMEGKLNSDIFHEELIDTNNYFFGLFDKSRLIGYSKIIFDFGFQEKIDNTHAKMERLYILKEFYDKKLGKQLFQFNLAFSKKKNQKGIWLYTWVENHRAISFYKSFGFEIVDSADFKISENHSNPNHIMHLIF